MACLLADGVLSIVSFDFSLLIEGTRASDGVLDIGGVDPKRGRLLFAFEMWLGFARPNARAIDLKMEGFSSVRQRVTFEINASRSSRSSCESLARRGTPGCEELPPAPAVSQSSHPVSPFRAVLLIAGTPSTVGTLRSLRWGRAVRTFQLPLAWLWESIVDCKRLTDLRSFHPLLISLIFS